MWCAGHGFLQFSLPNSCSPHYALALPRPALHAQPGPSAALRTHALTPPALRFFVAPVAEFVLDDGAMLKHSYVQTEAEPAFHIKATLVSQVRTRGPLGQVGTCWL